MWVIYYDDDTCPSEVAHQVLAIASTKERAKEIMEDAMKNDEGCLFYMPVENNDLVFNEYDSTFGAMIIVTYGKGDISNSFSLVAQEFTTDLYKPKN